MGAKQKIPIFQGFLDSDLKLTCLASDHLLRTPFGPLKTSAKHLPSPLFALQTAPQRPEKRRCAQAGDADEGEVAGRARSVAGSVGCSLDHQGGTLIRAWKLLSRALTEGFKCLCR